MIALLLIAQELSDQNYTKHIIRDKNINNNLTIFNWTQLQLKTLYGATQ